MMFGGPLKIPKLLDGQKGTFTFNYQLSRSRNGNTSTQTMPTPAGTRRRLLPVRRPAGSPSRFTIRYDGQSPFPGNIIPTNRIDSDVARPAQVLPALPMRRGYKQNYQAPITTINNSDNINSRLNQTISRKDRLSGGLGYMGSNSTTPNIFNFIDTGTGAQHQRQRVPGATTSPPA